LIILQAKTQRN